MAIQFAPERVGGRSWRETDAGVESIIGDRLVNVPQGSTGQCDAFTARRYKINDAHPCFANLVCREIAGRESQNDPTVYDVDYIFRAPDSEASAGGQFSMVGSLANRSTTRDRNDQQITLQYTYPAAYKDPLLAGKTETVVVSVDFQAGTQILRWTRLQTSFTAAYNNVNAVFGRVNQSAIYSKAAETLLCTRAEIEQANERWREIFEFQWQEGGWTVPIIFLQQDDNRPVANPDANSEKAVAVYPTYNYSLLGLLLPS